MKNYVVWRGINQACRFQGTSWFTFLLSGETGLEPFEARNRNRCQEAALQSAITLCGLTAPTSPMLKTCPPGEPRDTPHCRRLSKAGDGQHRSRMWVRLESRLERIPSGMSSGCAGRARPSSNAKPGKSESL